MKSKEARTTEHKLTAAQVESDCPATLQDLGKRIAVHLEKARKCEEKAEQHYTTVAQHLATAKEACDDGGFEAFQEKFFPALGRTRVYELLSIATNKKSIEQVRADTRARTAKSRAKKKTEASATVADKSEPDPSERQESPPEVAPANASGVVPDQRPEAAAARRAVTSKDDSLSEFTSLIGRLLQKTEKRKAERFVKTAIPADDLQKLGKFMGDLANLKKGSVSEKTADCASQGNVEGHPQLSTEHVKAESEALGAMGT